MLFLDDLHWADKATLECLSYFIACLKNHRILLIGTYRAEEALENSQLRTWLDKLGPERSYHPLRLSCLSREETALLLERLLRWRDETVFDWLYAETEGNPLFLVKLVRSLVQSGALQPDKEGRWRLVTSEINVAYLPESLQEVIRAALRRVPGRAQSLLGLAAVIGRVFELPILREVLHQAEEKLLDRLDELCRTGLILEHEGQYRFCHELTRQVIYESLSADRKRLWHRRVGQALEVLYGDQLDRWAGELVRHFERAQLWEKAVTYALRAGMRAHETYAWSEALALFAKALKLFERLEVERPLGRHLQQMKLTLLSSYTDLFPTVYDIAAVSSELRAVLAQMIALASELGESAQVCEAYQRRAWVELASGRRDAAWEDLLRALEIGQQIPDQTATANVLEGIGDFHAQLNEYGQAMEYFQRAGEIWVALGNGLRLGYNLKHLAQLQPFVGQWTQAEQNLERAYEQLRAAGNLREQAAVLNTLGVICRERGQWLKAQSYYEQSYQLIQEVGDPRGIGAVLINLGALQTDQGRYAEALSYFDRVLGLLSEVGTRGLEIEVLSEQGRAYLSRGELERALDCSTHAVQLLEAQQGIMMQAQRFYFTHFQVLQANRRASEAREYLQNAYLELQRVAGEISEEVLRKSFLENVPVNRQILQVWEAAQCEPKPPE